MVLGEKCLKAWKSEMKQSQPFNLKKKELKISKVYGKKTMLSTSKKQ